MKSYLSWVSEQSRSDDGETTVVATVFVLPIILMMIVTMIEVPLLMSNRNLLENDLRQGARTVAMLGGTESELGKTYGASDACERPDIAPWVTKTTLVAGKYNMSTVYKTDANMVTCMLAYNIGNNTSYIAFHIYHIVCGPRQAGKIGKTVWCQADYYYDGIPGGSMSLIGGTQHFGWGNGVNQAGDNVGSDVNLSGNTGVAADSYNGMESGREAGFNTATLRMSAQSEVCIDNDVCKVS